MGQFLLFVVCFGYFNPIVQGYFVFAPRVVFIPVPTFADLAARVDCLLFADFHDRYAFVFVLLFSDMGLPDQWLTLSLTLDGCLLVFARGHSFAFVQLYLFLVQWFQISEIFLFVALQLRNRMD